MIKAQAFNKLSALWACGAFGYYNTKGRVIFAANTLHANL
jgi:hypothetical protein